MSQLELADVGRALNATVDLFTNVVAGAATAAVEGARREVLVSQLSVSAQAVGRDPAQLRADLAEHAERLGDWDLAYTLLARQVHGEGAAMLARISEGVRMAVAPLVEAFERLGRAGLVEGWSPGPPPRWKRAPTKLVSGKRHARRRRR